MSVYRKPGTAAATGSPERRAALALLGWLLLLALLSAFVSVPFRAQAGAAQVVDYGHAIYLEALLVGVAGLAALTASDAFGLRGRGPRGASAIVWGSLGGAGLSGVGALLDQMVGPTSLIAVQLVALVPLGVAMVALAVGLMNRAASTRRTRDWTAAIAALGGAGSVFTAYVAAWILTFGNWPRALVAGYGGLMGMGWHVWLTDLVTGYAHAMPAAIVALMAATAATALSPRREGGLLVRIGLLWTAAGSLLATLIYMVSAFSAAQPPLLFQSGPAGLNGLWAGDLEIAVGVFLGALVTLAGLARERLPGRACGWAPVVLTATLFVALAGLGSYVQLHESVYGMGAVAAPRATENAAFGWVAQDVLWLLLPALLAVVEAVRRLDMPAAAVRRVALLLAAGAVVAFAGGLVYVLVAPAPTGPAFMIVTIGLALVALGVAFALAAAARGRGARAATGAAAAS